MRNGGRTTDPLAPIGPWNRLFFRVQGWVVPPLLKLFFRFQSYGEAVPGEGPIIVAANHASFLDPVVLQAGVSRRLHYLMTSLYYYKPLLNAYSRCMRCIPVMEGSVNREALEKSLEVLHEGRCIGVFPQGEIRPEEDRSHGMRGIALLAARSGAPVLPVRIRGTGRALPRGSRFPKPVKITVHRGRPFFVRLPAARGRSRRDRLAAATASIMDAIARL